MKQVYRILVTPYNYDVWSIFTEDKELFDTINGFTEYADGYDHFGHDEWQRIVESDMCLAPPYILLGETELRQYD